MFGIFLAEYLSIKKMRLASVKFNFPEFQDLRNTYAKF
jgi:hypothetical protein